MTQVVLASHNAHKLEELQRILAPLVPGIELVSYDGPEPVENGVTIGPTNTDPDGKPIGFFIEYGTSDTDPDPFVMRTTDWTARHIAQHADDLIADVL